MTLKIGSRDAKAVRELLTDVCQFTKCITLPDGKVPSKEQISTMTGDQLLIFHDRSPEPRSLDSVFTKGGYAYVLSTNLIKRAHLKFLEKYINCVSGYDEYILARAELKKMRKAEWDHQCYLNMDC